MTILLSSSSENTKLLRQIKEYTVRTVGDQGDVARIKMGDNLSNTHTSLCLGLSTR
ncbi:hypothetical protein ALC60_07853 [Trachymyrmex zeteki]|uniref:Uncharacterized protein n=1 Tax=Mycetomoellerius zeteki TaxID=64791 RepID=A0A151WZ11_9HYME|nr:hypothetical protein ALC60_07853 [Trachymyrmex zeteki]